MEKTPTHKNQTKPSQALDLSHKTYAITLFPDAQTLFALGEQKNL